MPVLSGSSKDQGDALSAARAAIQLRLDDLHGKIASVQRKAAAFSAQMEAFEPVRHPLVALLLDLDLTGIFSQVLPVEGGNSLPVVLEQWEVEVRNLAVRVAEAQTSHQIDFDAARARLQEMGKVDPAEVHELLPESLVASFAKDEVMSACRSLVSLEEGGAEALSLTNHATGVACLRGCFEAVAQSHEALDRVSSAATSILETYFVAVHKRLCDKMDSPRLSHAWVAELVSGVDSCLDKTRVTCNEGIASAMSSWGTQGTAPESRVEFPPPWAHPSPPSDHSLGLLAAVDMLNARRVVPVSWLDSLCSELKFAADEAQCLGERMARVTEALNKLSARESLRRSIVELDAQLSFLYQESSSFEQNAKDPSRLQDRTGKGRRDLANEEAQRKHFQKNIRKTLTDLKKALAEWEGIEHSKFELESLSEHGQEVRNAKTDAAISGKTQLMHLESSMQVGQPRRNSGDARRTSEEQSAAMTAAASSVDPENGGKTLRTSTGTAAAATAAASPDAPTPAKALTAAEVVQATPVRSQGSKGQKANPFAKMVSSRKSSAFAPQGNRSLIESTPIADKAASEVPSIQEQENLDPTLEE